MEKLLEPRPKTGKTRHLAQSRNGRIRRAGVRGAAASARPSAARRVARRCRSSRRRRGPGAPRDGAGRASGSRARTTARSRRPLRGWPRRDRRPRRETSPRAGMDRQLTRRKVGRRRRSTRRFDGRRLPDRRSDPCRRSPSGFVREARQAARAAPVAGGGPRSLRGHDPAGSSVPDAPCRLSQPSPADAAPIVPLTNRVSPGRPPLARQNPAGPHRPDDCHVHHERPRGSRDIAARERDAGSGRGLQHTVQQTIDVGHQKRRVEG